MSSVASPEGLIHLGMDTSKNTIVVATLLPGEESPVTDRIFNEEEAIRRLVGRFPDRSVLRAWYEAGPGGYDLYRLLASMGGVPGGRAVAGPEGGLGQGQDG
jgi:transposase